MLLRPEYDMKLVGHNLRRLRRAKKLSVETVREYLCLGSVQAIYKYEKGKCYPQADTLLALMELYDADIFDITRDHKEDDKSSYFFVRCVTQNCPLSRQIIKNFFNFYSFLV